MILPENITQSQICKGKILSAGDGGLDNDCCLYEENVIWYFRPNIKYEIGDGILIGYDSVIAFQEECQEK